MVIGGPGPAHDGQTYPIQARGLLVGEGLRCQVACPPRVLDGLLRDLLEARLGCNPLALLGSLAEVERKLGQVRRRESIVTSFERLGDPSMDRCSSIGRQRVVQRLPDEVVGEPVPSGHAGDRLQEARAYGLVERIDGLVRVVIRDAAEDLDAEFGSDHGAHRECGCGGGAQVADAARDDRLHAGRNRDSERR